MVQLLNKTIRTGNLTLLTNLIHHLPKTEINKFSAQETTPLHCAVWSGQHHLTEKLLDENGNPDVQDGESGWTALHRALYWGDFLSASILLQHGASLQVLDHQGRTALDVVSHELKDHLQAGGMLNVFSWGNGANYQLGTSKTELAATPTKIDALHDVKVVAIEAGKFHSCALTMDGKVFTWGWGRGGRLGHPEFRIHSGEGAQIEPRIVKGLAKFVVKQVSAGKHHTAVVTNVGEVFTWGSNKDGRLGYPSIDTQPTPKKVQLKLNIIWVSAGNRHTAIVTQEGQVYTWGSNRFGQLGYGTIDSGYGATPRLVESMQNRKVCQVSASKRHTVVLTAEGEVFTWGHRVVASKRVQMQARVDTLRSDKKNHLRFHKNHEEVTKPKIAFLAAGSAHTTCLTQQGVVLAWRSWDPRFEVVQIGGPLTTRHILQASAGKERTTVVTDEGDIYFWEGSSELPRQGGPNVPAKWSVQVHRQLGVKKAVSVAVGEKHTLALQSIWMPALLLLNPPEKVEDDEQISDPDDFYARAADRLAQQSDEQVLGSSFRSTEGMFDTIGKSREGVSFIEPQLHQQDCVGAPRCGPAPLHFICQVTVAKLLVDLRLCIQMLNYTESMRVDALQEYCMNVVLHNMDVVIQDYQVEFQELTSHVLEQLSELYTAHFRFVEPLKGQYLQIQEQEQDIDLSRFILDDFELDEVQAIDQQHEFYCFRLQDLVKQMLEFTAPGMRASQIVHQLHQSSPLKLVHQNSGASSNLSLLTQSIQAMKSGDIDDGSVFIDEAKATEQEAAFKLSRNIKKKLQQITSLETRMETGERMDLQQLTKIGSKGALEAALVAIASGLSTLQVQEMLAKSQETACGKQSSNVIYGSSPQQTTQVQDPKNKKSRKGKNKQRKSSLDVGVIQQDEISKKENQCATLQSVLEKEEVVEQQQLDVLPSPLPPPKSGLFGDDEQFPSLGQASQHKKGSFEKSSSGKLKKGQKTVKKGALSMFLSGELEQRVETHSSQEIQCTPKVDQTPPPPRVPTRPPKVNLPQVRSLRDIQQEEKRQQGSIGRRISHQIEGEISQEGLSLADFVRPVARNSKSQPSVSSLEANIGEQAPIPSPTLPPTATRMSSKIIPEVRASSPSRSLLTQPTPSLRSILEEQQHDKELMNTMTLYKGKHSSQTSLMGSSPPTGISPKVVGVSSSAAPSKWYVAEKQRVHSLAAIQVEEEAMQQLSKIYGFGNVRVVDEKGKRYEGFQGPQRIKDFDVKESSGDPSGKKNRRSR